MSREEDFLKRWSRRKREVAEAEKPKPPEATAETEATSDKLVAAFDPASLPPIESINELSDVTAFLRDGVPADLTRAALRRVWTADPAIREFVGLAENSWDFTDPNAIPGFGPLEDTEAVRRMIAQVVDQIGQSSPPVKPEVPQMAANNPENSNKSNEIAGAQTVESTPHTAAITEETKQTDADDLGNEVILQSNKDHIAMHHNASEAEERPKQSPRRGHGRALPQ